MYETTDNTVGKKGGNKRRTSSQPLLPQQLPANALPQHAYNIYPYHALGNDRIFHGYGSLAQWIAGHKQVVIDGYGGIFWKEVKQELQKQLQAKGHTVHWIDVSSCMKPEADIQQMLAPWLGTSNSLWGKRYEGVLADFFDVDALLALQPAQQPGITIAFGTGAALLNWEAPLIYLDLPKNEIQYRMRAGSITNLGAGTGDRATEMYKRFYFIDWVVLNRHKKNIAPNIHIVADAQWKESLNWMPADTLKAGIQAMSESVFRVRPWFEAGAWGGQWMKEHIPGLNKDEVNYAWSFEMIVPENGIVFESNGYLLEVSFDFLLFLQQRNVLGKHAAVFGYEFPIRFDFLDTWEGGNLSIQCHPTLPYIRNQFGETITQDETYYILDCKEEAQVYLGFQQGVDPAAFKQALEHSKANNEAVAIDRFVQSHRARKHDLFLIPNGTIHSAGKNNLVLEISATPYIFTFKMYDWLRLDLNGEPRAINIEHAFNNLDFERQGETVANELISKQQVVERGHDWQLVHCPTHPVHFYDVHRVEFSSQVTLFTNDTCHVLMLVEGTAVTVTTANGTTATFHYAETFVIPAAAKQYTLVNRGAGTARVVKAFCKDTINGLK
jgi:mannose-6-phosphate isomerase class I